MIVRPTVVWVDPTDDLQAAVDATPSGGTLYFGPGVFTAPDGGLILSKPIEIKGSGDDLSPNGTILNPFADAANQPAIVIARSATMIGRVFLHDFSIVGLSTVFRSGSHGVKVVTDDPLLDGWAIPLENIVFHRMSIGSMGADGIYAYGYNGASDCINNMTVEQVKLSFNMGNGLFLVNHVICAVRDCYIHQNGLRGILAWAGGYNFHNNVIEGCCQTVGNDTSTDLAVLNIYQDGQVTLIAVRPCSFIGNHIEAFASDLQEGDPGELFARNGLVIRGTLSVATGWLPQNGFDGGGFVVEGNIFVNDNEDDATGTERAILVQNSTEGNVHIGPNFFRNPFVAIEVVHDPLHVPENISVAQQLVETGNTFLAHDGIQLPTIRAADPLRNLGTAANVANLAGHLLYHNADSAIHLFNGAEWQRVHAGTTLYAVSHEGDVVTYDDEVVLHY